MALFHLRDWLAKKRGVHEATVHSEFESEFSQFQALADIANASKHFQLDRHGPRKGLSALDFKVAPSSAFSDGSYYSDGTSHSDADDVVRMEFREEIIDVRHLCEAALKYLKTKV